MRFLPRDHLPHDVPMWVADGAVYFVTIHCAVRERDQLTLPTMSSVLLESVAHYHTTQRWFARIFVLMPDHAHALLTFPRSESMRSVVADWKRYTARKAGVAWQRDFFDHRLRTGESWQLKAEYIRANPVRKGLVESPLDRPYIFEC